MTSWRNTRDTVLTHVEKAKAQYPDHQVVLVGHSLGGAVAALAGLEMQLRGWEPQVTTFGEPRVGNAAFATFLDNMFNLGLTTGMSSKNSTEDTPATKEEKTLAPAPARLPQFRRVTHIHDPVPLLPLDEWDYEPHGGEIFISKISIPPSFEDVVYCHGHRDPLCIEEGSDSPDTIVRAAMSGILPDVAELTKTLRHSFVDQHDPQQQQEQHILSEDDETVENRIADATENDDGDEDEISTSRTVTMTGLIPSRFRLWELFFAHRDYFWRLGLCVPGGDPTRIRL